jgi:pyruvate/2-oxoglutarate dehydrogenase complex dihydrolipoamide acyltransferase (E2) component
LAAQKIYIKLSVNDFTIKAAALALRKVPAVTEAVFANTPTSTSQWRWRRPMG